jgi:MFS family permease
MNNTVVLPLLASVVSFLFTLMVFDQFLRRRKTYQIVWTIGLFLFTLAAFSQFLGTAYGWRDDVNYYRLWYICGAIGTSAFLGMGTIFLIAPRRVALWVLAGLVLFFSVAAVLVFTAPVEVTALPFDSSEEVKGTGFPTYVRALTPFFNIFGAGFLAFGAAQSTWIFWRKRVKFYRVLSNGLIFAGAIAASAAGTIERFHLNAADAFSLATLLGVTLIFSGFLISIEVFEEFRIPFTNVVLKERKRVPETSQ